MNVLKTCEELTTTNIVLKRNEKIPEFYEKYFRSVYLRYQLKLPRELLKVDLP